MTAIDCRVTSLRNTKKAHSKHMRRYTFKLVSLLLCGALNLPPGFALEASAANNLLSTSDISCAGVFLTPGVQTGGFTPSAGYPVAFRYEADGKRHYFMVDGTGHILEFSEPTLSPCN